MVQHHFFSATRCWKCGGCCRCGRCGLHCTRNCGRMVRLSLKSLEAVSKPEGCRLSCPFQGAVPAQVKQCPLAPLVLAASTTYLPPGQTPPTHPPPPQKTSFHFFQTIFYVFPGPRSRSIGGTFIMGSRNRTYVLGYAKTLDITKTLARVQKNPNSEDIGGGWSLPRGGWMGGQWAWRGARACPWEGSAQRCFRQQKIQ